MIRTIATTLHDPTGFEVEGPRMDEPGISRTKIVRCMQGRAVISSRGPRNLTCMVQQLGRPVAQREKTLRDILCALSPRRASEWISQRDHLARLLELCSLCTMVDIMGETMLTVSLVRLPQCISSHARFESRKQQLMKRLGLGLEPAKQGCINLQQKGFFFLRNLLPC